MASVKEQSGGKGARVEPRVFRREMTAANWVVKSMRGVCSVTGTKGCGGFGVGEDLPEDEDPGLAALVWAEVCPWYVKGVCASDGWTIGKEAVEKMKRSSGIEVGE